MERDNYLFTTGTPSFLVSLLKGKVDDIDNIEQTPIKKSRLSASYDLSELPPVIVLYQTGYLTIGDYDAKRHSYTLTFPNEEVRESLPLILPGVMTSTRKLN